MLIDNIFRVVLFGHRYFEGHRELDKRLYPLLVDLIRKKPFVEIYIGRNGEFDIYAASIIKRIQNEIGKENLEFICVLHYVMKDIEHYEKYYDSIIIPFEKTHPKGAIKKRNFWMVERADLLVGYVEHTSGGAYTAMEYARRLGKQIINLADKEEDEDLE